MGLADRQPEGLQELPRFTGHNLDGATSGGDTPSSRPVPTTLRSPCTRSATSYASRSEQHRSATSQLGFGRTSSTSTAQVTARNLFGFKDGTANIKSEDTDAVDAFVWSQPGDGPAWM